jgi:hypothetical protein
LFDEVEKEKFSSVAMQQINTDRQQANSRLPRQLPANIIKETTLPSHQKHDNNNNNSKSATNGFDQLTGERQRQSPLRRLQTDLGDFDTHRSLSSCPTYSSLSRHSPETRVSEYKIQIRSSFIIYLFNFQKSSGFFFL